MIIIVQYAYHVIFEYYPDYQLQGCTFLIQSGINDTICLQNYVYNDCAHVLVNMLEYYMSATSVRIQCFFSLSFSVTYTIIEMGIKMAYILLVHR